MADEGYRPNPWMAWELASFLVAHRLSFDPIATHHLPTEAAPEAYRLADSGEMGKVVIAWD